MKKILVFLLLAVSVQGFSQSRFIDQWTNFQVVSSDVLPTDDGGYYSFMSLMRDSMRDLSLAIVRFDFCGEVMWANKYSAENDRIFRCVAELDGDDNLVVLASPAFFSLTNEQTLFKLDNQGNLVEGPVVINNKARSIELFEQAINNSNDILIDVSPENQDPSLSKWSSDFGIQWTMEYPGLSNEGALGLLSLNDTTYIITSDSQLMNIDSSGSVRSSWSTEDFYFTPHIAKFGNSGIYGVIVSPKERDTTLTDEQIALHCLIFLPGLNDPILSAGWTAKADGLINITADNSAMYILSHDTLPGDSLQSLFCTKVSSTGAINVQLAYGEGQLGAPFVRSFNLDLTEGLPEACVGPELAINIALADSSYLFLKSDLNFTVEGAVCPPDTTTSFRPLFDFDLSEDSVSAGETEVEIGSVTLDIDTLIIPDTILRICEQMVMPSETEIQLCPGEEFTSKTGKTSGPPENFNDDPIVVIDTIPVCQMEMIITTKISLRQKQPDVMETRTTCLGQSLFYDDPVTGEREEITNNTVKTEILPPFPCSDPMYEATKTINFVFTDQFNFADSIPNAFTPNSDGMNDRFGFPDIQNLETTSFSMKIFNRWGNLVFETTNVSEQWDGRQDGGDPIQEVYLFTIQIEGIYNGCEYRENINGDVTLIR